ncbi:hypothetical protein [Paenimyroides ceti]
MKFFFFSDLIKWILYMDFQTNGYGWELEEIATDASIVFTNGMIISSVIIQPI